MRHISRERERYLDAVDDALARNAKAFKELLERFHEKRSPPKWCVHCTSDVHTDFAKNAAELDRYVEDKIAENDERRRRGENVSSAIVVAGDVCTGIERLRTTMVSLRKCHDAVFYLPAGNHELWVSGQGIYDDSLHKMVELIDACTAWGVSCAPTRLSQTLAVVPIYGWYLDEFCDDPWRRSSAYTDLERNFDAACSWPPFINPPSEARNSHAPGIAAFMRDVNARALKRFASVVRTERNDATTIAFSHFLPRPELYRGNPALMKVMGNVAIDADARAWNGSIHVFGHSHLNVDRVIDGVRYVQCALGYPHERWFGSNHPKLLHRDAS